MTARDWIPWAVAAALIGLALLLQFAMRTDPFEGIELPPDEANAFLWTMERQAEELGGKEFYRLLMDAPRFEGAAFAEPYDDGAQLGWLRETLVEGADSIIADFEDGNAEEAFPLMQHGVEFLVLFANSPHYYVSIIGLIPMSHLFHELESYRDDPQTDPATREALRRIAHEAAENIASRTAADLLRIEENLLFEKEVIGWNYRLNPFERANVRHFFPDFERSASEREAFIEYLREW